MTNYPEGHHPVDSTETLVIRYAALAFGPVPAGLVDAPAVFTAVAVSCCGDHAARPIAFAINVREAGRLIASIEEYAHRAGMSAALSAWTDQGRSWAKGAPR